LIPSNINSISITLIGGDGGDANAGTNCYHNGGKGARIKGSFIITSASCASGIFTMQPGGILRFIRGRKGTNGTEDGQDFPRGFGGGGSAVLYQAPGTSNWLILLVAGAGGGAHADRGQIGLDCFGGGGFSASLTENGTNGGGTYGGQGGSNGNGGKAGGLIPGDGGGGGGAFSGGGDGSIPGLGGKQGFENGGSGGVIYIGAVLFYGGNGFGGGGAKNIAGGGGGGYSGGGGGSRDGYGAGGGGGSFVSPGAFNVEKMVMIGTDLSDGGSVRISTSAGSNIIAPTRIFVNDNATGSNNGTSWTNAFKSLQDALTAAVGNCATEIWVASGVYYPDEGNGFTDNNRNSSFNIKNGIAIYGGFAGGETNISQRNWNLNKTWLSGDLFKNGLVEGIGNSGRYPNYADNAYHVVSDIQTNETAVLDGFNIAGGNANGGGANNVGGGIYAANSTMVIRNCESRSNLANEGGGLFTYQSNVRLENCILRSNSVITGGGGACLKSNSGAYFLNCIFQANVVGTTTTDGGGGGAVVIEGSLPEFVNCTFSSNYAKTGGAVYNTNNASPIFYNTIMWSNESGNPRILGANPVVSVNNSSANYYNSLVENATLPAGQNNLPPEYPKFTQIDYPNTSPGYLGDLTLLQCSPAIDKGSNGFQAYPVDLAGNPRFVNTIVDLGAYEFQGVSPQLVQVTVGTSLPGLSFTVDNVNYSTSQTFSWEAGSNHALAISSPQGTAGTQHVFTGWSDGTAGLTGTLPTGGNGTSTYLWESSTDNLTFATAAEPSNGQNYTPGSLTQTTYYRRTVSSGGCSSTTASILITVNPVIATNTVSSGQSICTGSTPAVLIGTLPTGGDGSSYTYSWQSSTISATTDFTTAIGTSNMESYTPASLSQTTWYRRIVSSGGCSNTSSAVQITVNSVITNNTVGSAQIICSGSTAAGLTGTTPMGGDGSYTYLWQSSTISATTDFTTAIGTSNMQNYSPASLTQTTWYRRIVSSGGCSNTSSAVKITVNPVITNNTVSSAQIICSGSTPAGLTGTTPMGGDGSYTYLWQSSTDNVIFATAAGTSNGQNYTSESLTQTTYYRRTVTSGGCSTTTGLIKITVYPVITNNTVSSPQSIGTGSTPAGLTGTLPTGGNGSYTYLWESSTISGTTGFTTASGTSNGQNYSPASLSQTTWYRRTVTSGGVCSNTSTAIKITCFPCPNANFLQTTNITSNSVQLNWISIANPDQWQVEYKTTKLGSKWVDLFPTDNKRSVMLIGLLCNQNYLWQIRAKCGITWTAYSVSVSFKTTGCSAVAKVAQETVVAGSSTVLKVYPNPSNGFINLDLQLEQGTSATATVSIRDLSGRTVHSEKNALLKGTLRKRIQLPGNMVSGTYLVEVIANNTSYTTKLVLIR